jgi:hypothetical protein
MSEMACVTKEPATVYRALGGRRYLTFAGALRGYAKAKFRAKHRCECESSDYETGYYYNCHVHDLRDKVLPRYLRMLKRMVRRYDEASGSTK